MIQNSTIRQLIAFFLLIVLSIGVAPKAYFHDVIAGHTDTVQVCSDNTKSPHLHQSGINCHFDQLVVTSLYHFSVDPISEIFSSPFNTFHQKGEPFYFLRALSSTESRGPPSQHLI
ncbi:MAG TPA: hypothetical protein VNR87_12830 [Flavisolibacter sp.]|nr:hypothetical protein [Flavisolibacter sp.]